MHICVVLVHAAFRNILACTCKANALLDFTDRGATYYSVLRHNKIVFAATTMHITQNCS
jgi:hypothetical protein